MLGKVVPPFTCLVLSLASCSSALKGGTASQYPTPPETTDVQKRVLAEETSKAKAASDAATKDVRRFFDSQDFRSELTSCCPRVAKLSSQELLEHLRAEMKAAELAHSFPAAIKEGEHHSYDMTIAKIKENNFWLNEWLGPVKYGTQFPGNFNPAEEGPFGLPPFKNGTHPTWDEAADRLIYIVQNVRQNDFGSVPNFGDVCVVFKKSYVRNNVLIAAVDTGLWERTCNKSSRESQPRRLQHHNYSIDCSAWQPPQVGTLDYADHLILPNIASWLTKGETMEQAAGRLFARTAMTADYLDLLPIANIDQMRYSEANIVMNPRLPEGISFIIGDFAALFGSDLGTSLQELAQHYGWPLLWSRGYLGLDSRHTTGTDVPGNGRILDPMVSNGLNATYPVDAEHDFKQLWASVVAAQSSGQKPSLSQWEAWWTTLASQQLKTAPVSAYACSDPDSCVAVDASLGHCICHSEHSSLVV